MNGSSPTYSLGLAIALMLFPAIGVAQEFFQQTGGPEGGRFTELVSGNDGAVFTSTYWEIYRSTDSGTTWQKVSRADMNVAYDVNQILARPNGTVLAVYEERVAGGRGTGEPLAYESRVYRSAGNGDSTSWGAVNALWSVGRVSVLYSGVGPTIIAVTDSGVYRSTDDGINWQRRLGDVGTTINGAVAVTGDMYAIAQIDTLLGSRAYHSTDDGISWNPVGDTLPPWEGNITGGPAAVTAEGALLVPSPNGYGVWRLDHTSNPVWKSGDEGLPPSTPATFLHKAADGRLYVGIDEIGVFRSEDGGFSWKPLAVGVESPANAMTIIGNMLFIAGQNIYRSEDDGNRWRLSGAGIVHSIVQLVAVSRHQTLLAPIRNTLFRSTNGGVSWDQIILNVPRTATIYTIGSDDGGTLLAGTVNTFINREGGGGSIYRSTDDGLTWKSVNLGLVASNINQIAYGNGGWFAATDSGIYRSTNNGDSWSAVNVGMPTYDILTVVVTSGATLVGTRSNGIWRSTDNGATWTDANNGNNGSDLIFSIIRTPDGLLVAMDRLHARLYSSSDNGSSWVDLANKPTSLFILMAVASNSTGTLFLSALQPDFNPITLRSTDNGDSWQTIDTALTISSFTFDSTGRVYAGTAGQGVWRSVQSTTASLRSPPSPDAEIQLAVTGAGTIQYRLPQAQPVRLTLVDALGREVCVLAEGEEDTGEHLVTFEPGSLANGNYFLRLQASKANITQPVTIIR